MPGLGQRLDKWLWFARLAKSRTLAATLVEAGKVRVNRVRVTKPGRALRVADVLTTTIHGRVRVVRVLALGLRRGPAGESRTLYEDLTPAAVPASPAAIALSPAPARREPGAGRPTKRDRRRLQAWTGTGQGTED